MFGAVEIGFAASILEQAASSPVADTLQGQRGELGLRRHFPRLGSASQPAQRFTDTGRNAKTQKIAAPELVVRLRKA